MDKIASEAINAECGVGDPWTAHYGGDKREGQPDYAAAASVRQYGWDHGRSRRVKSSAVADQLAVRHCCIL